MKKWMIGAALAAVCAVSPVWADDDEEEAEAVKPAPVTVKPSQPKPQKPQAVPSPAVTYTEPEVSVTHADWSIAEKPEVVTLGSKKPQK